MAKRSKGSVRKRGRTWRLRYYVDGRRIEEGAGTGDERAARALLAERMREVAAGTWKAPDARAASATVERLEAELASARASVPDAPAAPLTVAAYLAAHHARRAAAGVRGARNEAQWWRDIVIPAIGDKLLSEVQRNDVRALLATLSAKTSAKTGRPLSPRTVLHVYRGLSTAFADAKLEGLVVESPCTLRTRRGELPQKRDRDPRWRASSVYSREEGETLISDPRIPGDRRTYYALELLAGLRTSEAAGARWADLDPKAQPLGRLVVSRQADGARGERPTKTGDVRQVPIVPALAAILEHWRTEGFPLLFARNPEPSDPIVPTRNDLSGRSFRVPESMHTRLVEDLEVVGMRRVPHAQHALRATFLSLLEVDGANMGIARRATHRAPGDVVGGYIRVQWSDVCREVAKLGISVRPAAAVLPLRGSRAARGSVSDGGREGGQHPGGVSSSLENQGGTDGPSRTRTCTRPVMSGEL